MTFNTRTPAFPQRKDVCAFESGMTLRDYFAAKAMQSLLLERNRGESIGYVAEYSYKAADAMIEWREK